MAHDAWSHEVLEFWFGQLRPDDWFTRNDEMDATIRHRFEGLWRDLRVAIPAKCFLDGNAALAATLVLDQFPRNMFRGTAEAFATDALALVVARHAVHSGFDMEQPYERRMFLYMPFMHSEALDDQERCVELFGTGSEEHKYAVEHRDIVAQFGRFPHRNRALGRTSSPEELTFLSGHQGFGQ